MSTYVALRDVAVDVGGATHRQLELELAPYIQAGTPFPYGPQPVPADLEIVATADGLALRLRFATELHGTCARCLTDAHLAIEVDALEIHEPSTRDPERMLTFVDEEGHLDASGWGQAEAGLQVPQQIVCNVDCKGLCSHCGANRNEVECDCVDEVTPDPRWDALRALQTSDEAGAQ